MQESKETRLRDVALEVLDLTCTSPIYGGMFIIVTLQGLKRMDFSLSLSGSINRGCGDHTIFHP